MTVTSFLGVFKRHRQDMNLACCARYLREPSLSIPLPLRSLTTMSKSVLNFAASKTRHALYSRLLQPHKIQRVLTEYVRDLAPGLWSFQQQAPIFLSKLILVTNGLFPMLLYIYIFQLNASKDFINIHSSSLDLPIVLVSVYLLKILICLFPCVIIERVRHSAPSPYTIVQTLHE